MTKTTQLNQDEEDGAGRRRIHLREISGDSETPLETVGQDLRAGRMRRGEDLATVSRALKIRKDHLSAVEEDDLESLPGKTYAIGFVRSYAGYLGLDATQMVERFKQEITGRHDENLTGPAMPDEDGRRLPQGWRIVVGVVVLALAYGAWHLLSAGPTPPPVPAPPAINPPRPKPAPPAQASAVPAPAPVKVPAPAAAPAPGVSPNAASPNAGPANVGPANAGPANVGSGRANPAPGAAATGTTALPTPAVAVAGTGQVYGAKNKNARVILHADGDTHIEVRAANGTVFINRDLKAGESYRVPNLPGLSLSSTNAGAVEMELDGQMVGRAGANQETAGDISLDPQAVADRGSR